MEDSTSHNQDKTRTFHSTSRQQEQPSAIFRQTKKLKSGENHDQFMAPLGSYIVKEDGLSSKNRTDKRSSSFQIGPLSSKKQTTVQVLPNFDIHDEVLIEQENSFQFQKDPVLAGNSTSKSKKYKLPSLQCKPLSMKKSSNIKHKRDPFVVDSIVVNEQDQAQAKQAMELIQQRQEDQKRKLHGSMQSDDILTHEAQLTSGDNSKANSPMARSLKNADFGNIGVFHSFKLAKGGQYPFKNSHYPKGDNTSKVHQQQAPVFGRNKVGHFSTITASTKKTIGQESPNQMKNSSTGEYFPPPIKSVAAQTITHHAKWPANQNDARGRQLNNFREGSNFTTLQVAKRNERDQHQEREAFSTLQDKQNPKGEPRSPFFSGGQNGGGLLSQSLYVSENQKPFFTPESSALGHHHDSVLGPQNPGLMKSIWQNMTSTNASMIMKNHGELKLDEKYTDKDMRRDHVLSSGDHASLQVNSKKPSEVKRSTNDYLPASALLFDTKGRLLNEIHQQAYQGDTNLQLQNNNIIKAVGSSLGELQGSSALTPGFKPTRQSILGPVNGGKNTQDQQIAISEAIEKGRMRIRPQSLVNDLLQKTMKTFHPPKDVKKRRVHNKSITVSNDPGLEKVERESAQNAQEKKPQNLKTLRPRKTMVDSSYNKAQTSYTLGESRERTVQKSEPRVEKTLKAPRPSKKLKGTIEGDTSTLEHNILNEIEQFEYSMLGDSRSQMNRTTMMQEVSATMKMEKKQSFLNSMRKTQQHFSKTKKMGAPLPLMKEDTNLNPLDSLGDHTSENPFHTSHVYPRPTGDYVIDGDHSNFSMLGPTELNKTENDTSVDATNPKYEDQEDVNSTKQIKSTAGPAGKSSKTQGGPGQGWSSQRHSKQSSGMEIRKLKLLQQQPQVQDQSLWQDFQLIGGAVFNQSLQAQNYQSEGVDLALASSGVAAVMVPPVSQNLDEQDEEHSEEDEEGKNDSNRSSVSQNAQFSQMIHSL